MHLDSSLFTPFKESIEHIDPPKYFTFPFFYTPHQLAEIAAVQLQNHICTQSEWEHDFGLDGHSQEGTGKMFGVLVVRSISGEIGFLSAFSGKLANQNLLPHFVPPVFDMLNKDSFFSSDYEQINQLSVEIKALQNSDGLEGLERQLQQQQQQYELEIANHRTTMIENRRCRKQLRIDAENTLNAQAYKELSVDLSRQSVADKNKLSAMKSQFQNDIAELQDLVITGKQKRTTLFKQRAAMSNALQHKLFGQYQFLNARNQIKDLNDIFSTTSNLIPPAGAGECAAPKLLHYAYLNGFKPLCFAEFWWGKSPKSEIRKHKQFYPSCTGKCQPILQHMLEGLQVDANPLSVNHAENKPLEIVYVDQHIVVVNKPFGLLSVPGKEIKDSAFTRLEKQYPDCEGPFVIHRLDMATSGLLVFALSKRANKGLQKQFITREVQKRYVAIIKRNEIEQCGKITLPLRGDQFDRPRQLVCFKHGKPAITTWKVKQVTDKGSKVYLYPETGRTHQLRVHCAHENGLNSAIVGDALYGTAENRLHLHAESLSFIHPVTHEPMQFQRDEEF
jgi:tRNA pseudouridine32 synthase/23S rRNA pseudouridine746 synthase